MKNKLELLPLSLFAITATLSFIVGNLEAGLGWAVATMVQLRIVLTDIVNNSKNG